MIWLVVALLVVIAVLGIVLWAVLSSGKTVITGSPTPEEAKIDSVHEEVTKKIVVTAERDKGELQHETAESLAQRVRDRILGVRK